MLIDLLEEEENERQKKEENERIELERLRKEDELMKVILHYYFQYSSMGHGRINETTDCIVDSIDGSRRRRRMEK